MSHYATQAKSPFKMKISFCPLAGFIFGILIFDTRFGWGDENEPEHFEFVLCFGLFGIKFTYYD